MKQKITDKNLIIINVTIVLYFIVIYLLFKYNVDYIIIGVLRELMTIPFMLAQIVFVLIGINYLIKNKIRLLTLISIITLAICLIITIASFY